MEKPANEFSYLLSLLDSVLKGETPPEPFQGIRWETLLSAAEAHSVANMAFYAVEKLQDKPPDNIMKRWSELRDKAVMKDIVQQTEFDSIIWAFREKNIRFMSLKGFILKSMYPQTDMRLMSDIDILIDPGNASAARDIMLSLGYECAEYGSGVHDTYYKKPVMSVEIHRELFGEEGREFAGMFSDPWAHGIDMDGHCQMTAEYGFAYILAHAVKHFDEGGTGIRTFIDLWIYPKAFERMDTDEICGMFGGTGRVDTCRELLYLSEVWFGGAKHTESSLRTERYVLKSGTYGTVGNAAENEIKNSGRGKYLFRLIFPTFGHMKSRYPVLKKAPVLLPFVWLFRLVTKPFVNRRQNLEKIRTLKKSWR